MLIYNPLDPAYQQDPYPTLHTLQRDDPVHYFELAGAWFLTRYADIDAVLRDPARFGSMTPDTMSFLPVAADAKGSFDDALANWLVLLNAPDHTRLRSLLSRSFTPKTIGTMRARVASICDELLAELPPAGELDIVEAFTSPLPLIVIAEALGVPAADRPKFKAWSDAIELVMDPIGGAAHRDLGHATAEEMFDYLGAILDDRRANPADDLMTHMVMAEDDGDRLTRAELLSTCMLLLFAGNETTTNLLGNSLIALSRHRDQLDIVRNDPAVLETTGIDELARFDTPSHTTGRIPHVDVEVGGRTIPAGARVVLVMAGANHDPEVFDDPDNLDLRRDPNPHLTFGFGHHYCLGAHLAKLEARVALPKLLAHLGEFELACDQIEYLASVAVRGPRVLPVRYGAAVGAGR